MKTLQVSLRALSHPVSLLSIGVLLLNDHVLKMIAPSFLTGKLSDFAGLFFFPFLLIAVLSIPLERTGMKTRQIAVTSLWITGMWFVGMKTIPIVNGGTEWLVEAVTGWQSQIVMDWTDLVALVSLWGAWRLVINIRLFSSRKSNATFSYFVLGIASLAAIATSVIEPEYIARVSVTNNVIYVGIPCQAPIIRAG